MSANNSVAAIHATRDGEIIQGVHTVSLDLHLAALEALAGR